MLDKFLCLIGLHYITERAKDDCYTYKYCDRCKTLFVGQRWQYIWKIMFGKIDKDLEKNTYLNKILYDRVINEKDQKD